MPKILLLISFILLVLGYHLFSAADIYYSSFLLVISALFIIFGLFMALIGLMKIKKEYRIETIKSFLIPTKGRIIIFLVTSYLWAFFISLQWILQERMISQSVSSIILWGPLLVPIYPFTDYGPIFPTLYFLIIRYTFFYIFSCFIIWAYNKLKHKIKLSFPIPLIIILAFVNVNLIVTKTLDFVYGSYEKSAVETLEETGSVEDAVAKCKKISEPFDYASCISNIALANKDPMICKENINIEGTTGYRLELCLAPVVMDLNDVSTCQLMPRKYGENECYVALAVKNNDPEICDLVEIVQIDEFSRDETHTKQKCIFYIEKGLMPQKYEKYR